MAYFAQAGSGQSHSHGGSRNEGAADTFGQGASSSNLSGPRVTVNPHVTARPVSAGQQPIFGQASQSQVVQPQVTRPASPFPVEGPDLYANYQPRSSEPETEAAPITFAAAAPMAPQSSLKDYVSEDYGVPGIGAQAYAAPSFAVDDHAAESAPEQVCAASEWGAQPDGQDLNGAQHSASDDAYGTVYGGTATQSYGYESQEQAPDYGYDDGSAYATPVAASGFARATGLVGAAASLALVVGLGVWGYQLVMRDVSGVPVVRAVEGPMRAQPENPGGSQVDHQGLAVNSVAANGTAEAAADRVTLAPQPIELSLDDQPMSRLSAPKADLPPQVINTPPAPSAPQVSDASVAAYRNGDIDALVAELTDGVAPIGSEPGSAAQQPAAAPAIVQPEPLKPVEIAAIGAATAPSSALRNAPGVKISLRPNLRPARFSPAVAQATPGSGRATLEVDPKSLPAGTRLAQLGAYESAAVARAEWDRIYSRFEAYLAGKQRVIQRAESGGRTFYRLRAMGFDGLSDARRFCSTLVAGKADCIPVTTR